jgi:hypothetical protein
MSVDQLPARPRRVTDRNWRAALSPKKEGCDMRTIVLKTALLAATLGIGPAAVADHNSPWGAGWAKMPNDIHNTRVETRGGNEFSRFVRQGGGASSVNRYSDGTRGHGRGKRGGMGGDGRGGRR